MTGVAGFLATALRTSLSPSPASRSNSATGVAGFSATPLRTQLFSSPASPSKTCSRSATGVAGFSATASRTNLSLSRASRSMTAAGVVGFSAIAWRTCQCTSPASRSRTAASEGVLATYWTITLNSGRAGADDPGPAEVTWPASCRKGKVGRRCPGSSCSSAWSSACSTASSKWVSQSSTASASATCSEAASRTALEVEACKARTVSGAAAGFWQIPSKTTSSPTCAACASVPAEQLSRFTTARRRGAGRSRKKVGFSSKNRSSAGLSSNISGNCPAISCRTPRGVAGLVTSARRVATSEEWESSASRASGAEAFLATTRASSTPWPANSASRSGAVAGSAASAFGERGLGAALGRGTLAVGVAPESRHFS